MRIQKLMISIAVVFLITTMAAYAAPQRVIVVFDDAVDEAAQEALVKTHGGTITKDLPIISGKAVFLPPQALNALAGTAGVVRIDADVMVSIQKRPDGGGGKPKDPPPAETLPWGVDRIDADLIWGVVTGSGVNVGVIDTGIDLNHPDLQVVDDVNIINSKKSGKDDNGHGTHVAGTIAGLDNDIGVIGVAPEANLYAIKVLDRRGSGWLSDVIAGIDWCINNGIDVVNMSLGSTNNVQSMHDAIIAANDAGIIIVAAAGNSGGAVIYPAAYTEVIAVSATDSGDNIAWSSSRGPEVELAGPGVDIYSAWKDGGYNTISGTSMATPHVTGVVALALSASVANVREKMQTTAEDLGAPGRDNLYGYGLVDAKEIIIGIATTAPPRTRNVTPTGKTATVWGSIKNQ